MSEFRPNTLYYGDNLDVLRDFPSECETSCTSTRRSIRTARTTCCSRRREARRPRRRSRRSRTHGTGTTHAAETYDDVASRGDDVGRLLRAFVEALGHNDVTAYLTMMAPRLLELRRVMKPTASIYLHCDPTASHYLKVLMDAVFRPENFKNEIIWKRTMTVKGNFGQGSKRWGQATDTLLFFSKTNDYVLNQPFRAYSTEYTDGAYRHIEPTTGRRYRLVSMIGPGGAAKGNPFYEVMGVSRYWRYSQKTMQELIDRGLVIQSKPGAVPNRKYYLDEGKGVPIQSLWDDIPSLQASDKQRLGYPTQKPEALLERVIAASSNPSDVVLDPFCGCGTATVAAHRLGRQWIGIDVTYLAVDLMRQRLIDAFPADFPDGVPVDGEPADEVAALALAERDKYQFQFWAVAKIGGTARGGVNRKGPDRGIDGVTTFPERDPDDAERLTLDHQQVLISVKGGGTSVRDVRTSSAPCSGSRRRSACW